MDFSGAFMDFCWGNTETKNQRNHGKSVGQTKVVPANNFLCSKLSIREYFVTSLSLSMTINLTVSCAKILTCGKFQFQKKDSVRNPWQLMVNSTPSLGR